MIPAFRWITANRAGTCAGCHVERIERGFTVLWFPRHRRALCLSCGRRHEARAAETDDAARQAWVLSKATQQKDTDQ